MYLEHFGLKELPFLSSPDARFLYLSDQVNETLQKCLYMIANRIGPLYVYGPIGTGKTTLAKRLHQQLDQDTDRYVVVSLVLPPQLRVNALLRLIMDDFGIKMERSYAASLTGVGAWLMAQHRAGVKPNTGDLRRQNAHDRRGVRRRPCRRRMGRWPLERVVAHLALDDPRVLARAAGRQPFGGKVGQKLLAKRGSAGGVVRWARGMARRSTCRAPVKLRRSGSVASWTAAWYISVRIARCASSSP